MLWTRSYEARVGEQIMIDTEVWKKVEGFPNYSVSSFGRVRNDKTDTFKTVQIDKDGYFLVELYHKKRRRHVGIHRLVAETFIENADKKPCVNHIDGNKQNNYVSNLEWVTVKENNWHCRKTLKKGIKSKSVICVETQMFFPSCKEAAQYYGVCPATVTMCCRGQRKTVKGYQLKYFNARLEK